MRAPPREPRSDPGTARDVNEVALDFIHDGDVIGLGSGQTALEFVHALAKRFAAGLRIQGIPTSRATQKLATALGIPLTSLDETALVDVTVDGADEVDPELDIIKGYGGALVREKIVAAASRQVIILVDADKLVPVLGTRGMLPVEVVPFGFASCARQLAELGCEPTLRRTSGRAYVTDNGNHILDCAVRPIPNPAELEQSIRRIAGVVDSGLFVHMANVVLVQDGATVTARRRERMQRNERGLRLGRRGAT